MNRYSPISRGLAAACCVLCVTPLFSADVRFYPVGQLAGGKANSQIRDAVLEGDEIVAVGFATQNPASGLNPGSAGDTAVVWTLEDGLVPLPADVPGMTPPAVTRNITASAVASRGLEIAYRSLTDNSGQDVVAALATHHAKDLTIIGVLPGMPLFSAAVAVSADGRVVYGFNANASGQQVPFRWTPSEGMTSLGLAPGATSGPPAGRATTADGSMVVGGAPSGPGGVGYVYRHGRGVSALPRAAGGTWTTAFAITPGGRIIAGTGDSAAHPGGEFLLWRDGRVEPLGLPGAQTSTNFTNFGGLAAAGRVLVTFDNNSSYLHNAHGWFDLKAVIEGAGVNLSDWTSMLAFGVSPNGRLVFGSGFNSTGSEGFVAEFPRGYLLNYGRPAGGPPQDGDGDDDDT
jgi:probable HAF family extracellular repeat protein